MVDRFTPKITSIYDEVRREMHVISVSARPAIGDNPLTATISTSTRTFTEEEIFGGKGIQEVSYKDPSTIQHTGNYDWKDSANGPALALEKQPADADLEMIGVVFQKPCLNPDSATTQLQHKVKML